MESGIITMFAGTILQIPDGWFLCDGDNGTPDLRDKFVLGAGLTFAVGATGGVTAHNHTFTGDSHRHTTPIGTDIASGAAVLKTTDYETVTGITVQQSNVPPYYALAYMMKS